MKRLLPAQTLVLAAGTAFAWKTVFGDFSRFFSAGGRLLEFSGCRYPNPLATPCFYGAIVFVIALVWSILIWQSRNQLSQKYLSRLLLAGTLFAWTVTGWEFYKFFKPRTGEYIGCGGVPVPNPIYTPCFTGASLYLISFLASFWIIKKMIRGQSPEKTESLSS